MIWFQLYCALNYVVECSIVVDLQLGIALYAMGGAVNVDM